MKSKKQKKGKVNDALMKKEEKKNIPKADNESKIAKEPPKDYIHVRARRGQATDSHSLAERVSILLQNSNFFTILSLLTTYYIILSFNFCQSLMGCCLVIIWFQVRREKISERMKILQKLVPGCDKVYN